MSESGLRRYRPRPAIGWRLALLFLIVGCHQDDGIRAAESVPPLSLVPNVHLPASVREVARLRPKAVITSFGLYERVGGSELRYYAGTGTDYTHDRVVDSSAKVWALEAEQTLPDDATARAVAADLESAIASGLGSKSVCTEPSGSARRTRFTGWIAKTSAVYIRRQFEDSVQTMGRWVAIPATLITGFALAPDKNLPWFAEENLRPCIG